MWHLKYGAVGAADSAQSDEARPAHEIPSTAIRLLSAIAVAEKDMEAVACVGLENVETE